MYKSKIKWYHYIPVGITGGVVGWYFPPAEQTLLFCLGCLSMAAINTSAFLLIDNYFRARECKTLKKG